MRSRPRGSFEEVLATGSLTSVLLSGCLLSGAMAAQLVVALLALTSLGAASEPDCKQLVKPLVLDSHSPVSIRDHLLRAWHVCGGSRDTLQKSMLH